MNHQEHLFYRTLTTSYFHPVNIAEFLRTAFFIEHHQWLFLYFLQIITQPFCNLMTLWLILFLLNTFCTHEYSVTIPRCYKDAYVNSFFPCTARLVVAVQPWMEWIPIKKKYSHWSIFLFKGNSSIQFNSWNDDFENSKV